MPCRKCALVSIMTVQILQIFCLLAALEMGQVLLGGVSSGEFVQEPVRWRRKTVLVLLGSSGHVCDLLVNDEEVVEGASSLSRRKEERRLLKLGSSKFALRQCAPSHRVSQYVLACPRRKPCLQATDIGPSAKLQC